MKKVFLESLAYNVVGFIFDDGMVVFDCDTIEEAKTIDCSEVIECKTAKEAAMNCCTEKHEFIESEWENVTFI